MKVVMITGSPHRNGTSSLLADEFIRGAKKSGHEVFRFDSAFKNVHPCNGCDTCKNTDKGCIFKDDMEELDPKIIEADVIVFVSPIYYYAVNAQIKSVMDRFYANDEKIHKNKKAAILLTCGDDTMESAQGPIASFEGMTNFVEWERIGELVALNCYTLEDIKKTVYPKKAFEMGENL